MAQPGMPLRATRQKKKKPADVFEAKSSQHILLLSIKIEKTTLCCIVRHGRLAAKWCHGLFLSDRGVVLLTAPLSLLCPVT